MNWVCSAVGYSLNRNATIQPARFRTSETIWPTRYTSEHRVRAYDHTTALAEHSGMTSFSVRSTESASTQR